MENPLKSLKIKNYYSYLLVLGGFVFIISLFYDPKIMPQGKLTILCLITIVYGLVEWMRESAHKNKVRYINHELQVAWEAASSKKGLVEIQDGSWDSNFRKKFLKENKAENLIAKYQFKTWVFFIIYLFLMIGAFYFV